MHEKSGISQRNFLMKDRSVWKKFWSCKVFLMTTSTLIGQNGLNIMVIAWLYHGYIPCDCHSEFEKYNQNSTKMQPKYNENAIKIQW